MISLPRRFAATKYAGYFFDVESKKLYSIKQAGVLKEMKAQRANRFNDNYAGYSVSHEGKSEYLRLRYLCKLQCRDEEIKVINRIC